MTGAKVGIGEGCFTITIKDTKSIMPAQFEFEHLLHPTTLDSAIQTASQAIEHERGIVTQLMVVCGLTHDPYRDSQADNNQSLLDSKAFVFQLTCQKKLTQSSSAIQLPSTRATETI